VLDMTGDPARPAITAGCALLTADEPPARSPFDGLTPEAGNHSPALEALNPASTKPLGMKPHSAGALLHELRWAPVDELQTPSHIPQAAPSA
jgi:hypothetical protein